MQLAQLTSATDPLLEPWLDLYQSAFPLEEQLPVSAVLSAFRRDQHELFAVLTGDTFIGLAWLERAPEYTFLWYLAIQSDYRSHGYGGRLLEALKLRAHREGAKALLLEAERPDHAPDRALAERRIAFYRKHGGMVAQETEYWSHTGWQPPVPMHLLAIPLIENLSRTELRSLLERGFIAGLVHLPDPLTLG